MLVFAFGPTIKQVTGLVLGGSILTRLKNCQGQIPHPQGQRGAMLGRRRFSIRGGLGHQVGQNLLPPWPLGTLACHSDPTIPTVIAMLFRHVLEGEPYPLEHYAGIGLSVGLTGTIVVGNLGQKTQGHRRELALRIERVSLTQHLVGTLRLIDVRLMDRIAKTQRRPPRRRQAR